MAFKYIIAPSDKIRLLHFDGDFRLVKDVAREKSAKGAINAGFFSMSKKHPIDSYPVGLVATNGGIKVWPNNDASHFHLVHSKGGKLGFGEILPQGSDWGISMGPRLIEKGEVCERSISDPKWPAGGVSITAGKPRVAIGMLADGQGVLAYWDSITMRGAAQDLLGLGCVEALAGDGGGSASWGQDISQRLVPNCLIIEGDSIPVPEPPVASGRPRVYLSPSNQRKNIGYGEYGSEQFRMRRLAWNVGRLLEMQGADVAITRSDQEIPEIVKESNIFRPIYHICLHSNYFDDPEVGGVEGFYWPGSIKGEALTRDICRALSELSPGGFRRVVPDGSFGEIAGPDAVCSYIEVGFHGNPVEAAWIMVDTEMIAFTIAKVVGEHLGLPPPEDYDCFLRAVVAEGKLDQIREIMK